MASPARTPYPWQLQGRDFLLEGGSCLAHDPGLGKSGSALLADQARGPSPFPLLVACPSVAIGVWQREVEAVTPNAYVHVITDASEVPAYADVCVVSMDLPARNTAVAKMIQKQIWRRLVVDESHRLKTMTSQRTQFWLSGPDAIAGIVSEAWLLTGTPAPNGLCSEVYPLVKATQPDRFAMWDRKVGNRLDLAKSFEAFCDYFMKFKVIMAGGKPRKSIVGNEAFRLPKFASEIDGWMMRLKKDDSMLPPKLHRVIPLPVADLEAFDDFMDTEEGRAIAALIAGGNTDRLQAASGAVSTMRRLLARAKVTAAADWIEELLEDGEEKIVVFGWHIDALTALRDRLTADGIATVFVTGDSTASERTSTVAQFQTSPGKMVFIGNIAAAGVAITLTAARRVVFLETSWVPGDNIQAADRCHRMGQQGTVVIDYLVAANTIDENVAASLQRKLAAIDTIGA